MLSLVSTLYTMRVIVYALIPKDCMYILLVHLHSLEHAQARLDESLQKELDNQLVVSSRNRTDIRISLVHADLKDHSQTHFPDIDKALVPRLD